MKKALKKLFLPIVGFLSLIWFLVRVLPKPSRAAYPCMRAAAPLASTFVLYVVGFLSSIFFFKKAKRFWQQSRYVVFGLALLLGTVLALSTFLQTDQKAYALVTSPPDGPNNPMGTGVGLNSGRVVWIHNPDATDETCSNRRNDYWYMDSNTNQEVVNKMVSDALQKLTGKSSDAEAWDAIFHYYNSNHGKGDVGYTAGEKFVIKINLNGGTSGNSYDRWNYERM